jgi:hypothetical protein
MRDRLTLKYILGTNIGLINIISDVCLIGCLGNISTPSRHEFHIVKIALFPFELEVGVNGNIESI